MTARWRDPCLLTALGLSGWELSFDETFDHGVLAGGGVDVDRDNPALCLHLRPDVAVYGVQAAGASAIHDSWHAKTRLSIDHANTFADGLATRGTYDLTWPALAEGLAGFVTVTEAQLAEAIRLLLRATHNLAEGAGAAGLAGLAVLREQLAGKTVGVILSGSNLDAVTLRRVMTHEL